MIHLLGLPTVPVPWPEGAEQCPKCRRSIPGGVRPTVIRVPFSLPLANTWSLSEKELLALCPIDGLMSQVVVPSGRSQNEIDLETATLVVALREAGYENWSGMLQASLQETDPAARLSYVGHALAILLRRCPFFRESSENQRDVVRQLLVDNVVLWPQALSGT